MASGGGAKVNTTKSKAIAKRVAIASFCDRQRGGVLLKRRASLAYAAAAATKKIAIFTQSGDLPIAPL